MARESTLVRALVVGVTLYSVLTACVSPTPEIITQPLDVLVTTTPVATQTIVPTSTRSSPSDFGETYKYVEAGVSFRVVMGYKVADNSANGLGAVRAVRLHSSGAGPATEERIELWMFYQASGQNSGALTPEILLEMADGIAENAVATSVTMEMVSRETIEVDGSPAVVINLKDTAAGKEKNIRIASIVDSEKKQGLLIMGTASPDLWKSEMSLVYDALLSSLELFEPISASPTVVFAPTTIVEEFEDASAFTQTSGNVYISDGKAIWNFSRQGGDQFIYRSLPPLPGNVRITIIGQIDNWTNNCRCGAGIGDAPGSGIAIHYGFVGGGCSTSGPVVTTSGISLNITESNCHFSDGWQWISRQTPYKAVLTVNGQTATLGVNGIGQVEGAVEYSGEYDVLWVGNKGDGDWPSCSGSIESIVVELLK